MRTLSRPHVDLTVDLSDYPHGKDSLLLHACNVESFYNLRVTPVLVAKTTSIGTKIFVHTHIT